ncbi:ATP-binding protein [Streptomyces sp. NPDC050161]|uniref:ATP-binding protein n=1 Tax=Streptomyces sp. NPDC050161 TaxID=3365604 RepID=UPI0037938A46
MFFSAVIQGEHLTVQLPREITPALSGLPSCSPAFTGREDELAVLSAVLAPSASGQPHAGTAPLAVVTGLGGVGKTELALQSAHRARARQDWFPGGVLFTQLFGYDPERRVTPEQALASMLRALGLPGEHVPATLEDRARLYRSVLSAYADEGRRILVVLDNARDTEQVAPLLPGDPRVPALVTSRQTLTDLDARLVGLDSLDEPTAVDLLRRTLHQAHGASDTRVDAEPGQAAVLVSLCGGLPLALRIAGALLIETPARPLSSLTDAFRDAGRRLRRMESGTLALRTAFDLSYAQLPAAQARLFRMLPLNPGPDLTTEAAAHLTGTDHDGAEELLRALARAHLIEPGLTYGRWRLHDLARLYADELGRGHAAEDGRTPALGRLLDHYVDTAEAADAHLTPPFGGGPFATRHEAVRWLDAERPNLLAAASLASARGRADTVFRMHVALGTYLNLTRHYEEWRTVSVAARHSALDAYQLVDAASALNNEGLALQGLRRFDEAVEVHTRAAEAFAELGHPHAEAMALDNLGTALRNLWRIDEAIEAHTRAATFFRQAGDRHQEATTLGNLGNALRAVRRFAEAAEYHERAVAAGGESGDRHGEAIAIGGLGSALLGLRRYDEAISAYTRQLAIYRETGHPPGQARALGNLGHVLRDVRRYDEAISAHIQAAELYRKAGDLHGEGIAYSGLGLDLLKTGSHEEAVTTLHRAAGIHRETGELNGEAVALCNLASALQHTGRLFEAIDAAERSAARYRETGDGHGEALALHCLGNVLWETGRYEESAEAHGRSAALFQEVGDRRSEMTSLLNLRTVLTRLGRQDEATRVHRRAAELNHVPKPPPGLPPAPRKP